MDKSNRMEVEMQAPRERLSRLNAPVLRISANPFRLLLIVFLLPVASVTRNAESAAPGATTETVVMHVSDDDPDFPCDESLGYGRVVRDGQACVILDTIIVMVSGDMDQAAEELGNRPGWTVIRQIFLVPILIARYSPDVLTLADLKAEMAAIARMPWARIVEHDAIVYAAGPEGGNIVTASEGIELPAQIALDQNYPNPFNPETTIGYALPQASEVRLVVYDLLGHEMAVLVDGLKPAGRHTVRFAANHLPNGAYLYRLVAGEKTITRTMVVVK